MIGKARSNRSAGIEAIDLATRWPLYLGSASEPFLILLLVVGRPQLGTPAAGVLVVTAVLHAVARIALLRAGLAHYLGERRPALFLIALGAALTVAGVLAALVSDGGAGLRLESPVAVTALIFCAAFTCALAPLLTAVLLLGLTVVAAAGV